ncbi:LysR family transcriptional regulator [Nocardia sp. NPDC051750]|uniref:LysR family transcriptional regulator n=1 Tax=Nocardia sp. NPDC051750 TaxID=3364325 RepID=UPI0037B465BE
MELRQLEYFVAVADLGSVSAASERLFVTQPAISRQIARLEQELGVHLFHRTSGGLKLNAAGQRLYPMARDIQHRVTRSAQVMKAATTGQLPMTVTCPPTVVDAVAAFIAATATPILDIRAQMPAMIYDELARHAADLAIGTSRPPRQYASLQLLSPPLSLQAPPGNRLCDRSDPLDLADLVGEALIISAPGSAIRHVVDEHAAARSLALTYVQEVSSSTVAQALASAGQGIAIVGEPRRFGLLGRPLTSLGTPITIANWAAWELEHYAAPEIHAVATRLATWLTATYANPLTMSLYNEKPFG